MTELLDETTYAFRMVAELACQQSYGGTQAETLPTSDQSPGDHTLSAPAIGDAEDPFVHYPPLSYTPVGCHFPDPSVSGGVIYWEERWDDLPDFMGGPVWGVANPLMYGGANGQVTAEGDFWFGDHPGFSYSIRAYDEGGGHTSEWSDIFGGTVTGTPSSGTSDLAVTVTSGSSVSLTWSGEQGMYYVLGGNGAGATYTAIYPSFGVPMSISGLAAGNWKFVVFTATSAMSNVAEAILGLPATPAGLHATLGDAKNEVHFAWQNTPNNEVGYLLQYWDSATSQWSTIAVKPADETVADWTLPSDYAGKTYDVRLRAYNAVGNSAYATTQASGIALRSVSFGGILKDAAGNTLSGGSSMDINKDDCSGPYSGSQWLDANMNDSIDSVTMTNAFSNGTKYGYNSTDQATREWEQTYPLSYIYTQPNARSFMVASPTCAYGLAVDSNWQMRGTGGGYTFAAQSPSSSGGWVWSDFTAGTSLPAAIDSSTLNITWEVSVDGGTTWIEAGTSNNHLYVNGSWYANDEFETIVHVSSEAAKTKTPGDDGGKRDIVEDIWTEAIETKAVLRVDGVMLTYYGFYDANRNGAWDAGDSNRNSTTLCTVTSVDGLLQTGNGQCNAWAEFFATCIRTQGAGTIAGASTRLVAVQPKAGGFFATKGWTTNGAGPLWEVVSLDAGLTGGNPVTPNLGEAADVAGVVGQGNSPNPPSNFDIHWIVLVDGEYYDPSYALGPYLDLKQFEDAAMSGSLEVVAGTIYLRELPLDNGSAADQSDLICTYTNVLF